MRINNVTNNFYSKANSAPNAQEENLLKAWN